MTTFTVVIPTHNHADTLSYAVRSVLWQTCQDFELFIVGDGVTDKTREVVAVLVADDARIRFFDNAKGDRHGELHRHHALREANGRFVAYQADDDLWMPEHLAAVSRLLENHDLVHCMQMEVSVEGQLSSWIFDAHDDPTAIERMRKSETGFGLASGAHRLDAYRRLPAGWHPAPQGINTDLYFWLQFLNEPWCRYRSYKWPNVVHLSSLTRKDWSPARRADELKLWWEKIQAPSQRDVCVKECLLPLHDEIYKKSCEISHGTELLAGIESMTEALRSGSPINSKLHTYTLGDALRFGVSGKVDHHYPLIGCYPAEDWGRWTNAAQANVVLTLAAPVAATLQMDLDISCLVSRPARPVCEFSIQVNGVSVLSVQETRQGLHRHTMVIPESLCAGSGVLSIGFLTAALVRPLDLGIGADERPLGIGLVSLRVRRQTLWDQLTQLVRVTLGKLFT